MITTCPICGKSLKEGEIFCKNCEALLSDDDTDSGQLSKNKMTNFTQNAISKREETWQEKFLTAEGRLNRKPYILRGWILTCHPQTLGHHPIYICGKAATTTLNPEPDNPFHFPPCER